MSEDGLEFEAGVSTTLLESLDASVSLFSKKTFEGADEVRPSIEIGTSIALGWVFCMVLIWAFIWMMQGE